MIVIDFLERLWPHIVATLALLLTVLGVSHVVINKKDSRTAVAWAGIIFLFPFLGALLYLIFGINRIKRKAFELRGKIIPAFSTRCKYSCSVKELEDILPADSMHLIMQEKLVSNVTKRPLVSGNSIKIFSNGDEAYPAMINAIENAEYSISLASFIFADDKAGKLFVDSLARAVKRGIQVRVLIDDFGFRFSFASIFSDLHANGITAKRFMPTLLPWRAKYMNLRNHRKILVTDGKVGFTGGMNISFANLIKNRPSHPVQDIHFRVKGPIVSHLQEAFAEDWFFTAGEALKGEFWFPELTQEGAVIARGITDGPDEDYEKLQNIIIGALSCAQRSVQIVTPYFLPEPELINVLKVTAMRGVNVDIIIPERGNHRLVAWASSGQFDQLLEKGCRIWLSKPPFDHSKLMIVDNVWSLIGSANWDPRSLKLNFEFNVECYSRGLADSLNDIFDRKRKNARLLMLEDVNRWTLAVKLRNGLCRLFLPYL